MIHHTQLRGHNGGMKIPRNDYFTEDGQITFVPCINWIPGLIHKQIRSLPAEESDFKLGDLFEDPESSDWDERQRHQRNYEWRETLIMLSPNWSDWSSGFEGLGSLFGSEENE